MEDASFKPYPGWSTGSFATAFAPFSKKYVDSFLLPTRVENEPTLAGSVPVRQNPVPADSLVAVPSGIGASGRLGRVVVGYSLRICGSMVLNPYLSDQEEPPFFNDRYGVALYVVLDKCTDGNPRDGGQMFQGTDALDCMLHPDAEQECTILARKMHVFRPGVRTIPGTPVKYNLRCREPWRFDFEVPLKMLTFTFDGADGTIDEMPLYSVHLYAGNQAALPTSQLLQTILTYQVRFVYFDAAF